jgi:aminopeptidase N
VQPALLILALWPVPVVSPAPATGVPAPLGVHISDYDVALDLDRDHKTVTGRERLRLRAVDVTEAVVFPRNGINLRAARAATGEELTHVETEDRIEIRLPKPLLRGRETSIDLEYEAAAPRGVAFHTDAVYTSFYTCHWMICRERPDEKATLTLALTVPDGLAVVANGLPIAKRRPRPGWTEHVWRDAVPSSTYLFGFAVGDFTRAARMISGVRFEYYGPELDAARRDELAAEDARILAFFVEKAGHPLPRPFYLQVTVDGDIAQEMSSFSVLGRDLVEARRADPSEDWAAAHELAHQFWGNLVTCADWPHFWLNEGITTFMVAAWKEHRWGRAAYDRELDLARKAHQTAIDAGFDVPLAFAGPYPSLRMKRAITYKKAELFLDRLRATMGDASFWKALRAYTRKFAGRAVVSRDFETVFQTATRVDLGPLFKEWVYVRTDQGRPPEGHQ